MILSPKTRRLGHVSRGPAPGPPTEEDLWPSCPEPRMPD